MTIRAILSILIGFFVLGGGGYAGYQYISKPKPQVPLVCPTDLKSCAGGLSVGRVLPSCEFSLCPEDRPKGSGGITVLPRTDINGPFEGSLNDLRTNGGDHSCAFEMKDGGTTASGTARVSQGEAAVDLSIAASGRSPVLSRLVVGENDVLWWKEGSDEGIRAPAAAFTSGAVSNIPLDPTATTTFSCTSWTRDPALFAAPEGVTFAEAKE